MKKIQTKKDNEIFSRFEFKYIIKRSVSEAIQNEVKNFTKIDGYANNKDKYLVRSLYFDNNLFSNFHDKGDGVKKRYKFRIEYGKKSFFSSFFGDILYFYNSIPWLPKLWRRIQDYGLGSIR